MVVNEGHTAILSAQAIQQFQLMTVNSDNMMSVDSPPAQSDLIAEFSDDSSNVSMADLSKWSQITSHSKASSRRA